MKANRWLRSAAAVALVGAAGACDMDLTEINENPNNPEEVPVESVLASGIWDLISNNPGRGVFGEWTTLYHTNIWAQHLAQSAYNDEDQYKPREGINESIWAEMYAGALTDLKRTRELAGDDQNLAAISEILTVYGFLFLTDLFGDVPYTQALNLEEYPSPEFTPQSEIYPALLDRLAAAAAQINPGASTPWAQGDLIYGGDMAKWRKFANSLRLRIAMRISGTAAAADAQQHFSAAWNAERFTSNADNATLAWTGTLPSQNPIYEQIVLGSRTNDFRVSATLTDLMGAKNDPRLPVYANPAVSDGVIRGLTNGYEPPDLGMTANDFSTIGSAFVAADAPSVLMSYAEVLLLGAEAAAKSWIGADAGTLYEQGIAASMQQHGIAQAEIDAYLAQPSVQYTGVEDIHAEKWVALYLAGPEAYAEVRRTEVPDLPLPFGAVLDNLPTRMPYPANEGLYNENFAEYADVDMTVPMWWMP